MLSAKPTFVLVDGTAYLYRAFHGLKQALSAPDGTPTGALYGVLNMLKRLEKDVPHTHACCVFDAKGSTFRHDLYEHYKGTRKPMPDDLRAQAERMPSLVQKMGWPTLSVMGVEADDVMATLAKMAEESGFRVVISSADKDLMQLVNDNIVLFDAMRGKTYDAAGVKEKFKVAPAQIIDFLTLVGDKSDNVPGVAGWGEDTAAKWLDRFGNIETILQHLDEVKGRAAHTLAESNGAWELSRRLVTVRQDVDLTDILPRGLAALERREPAWSALISDFIALGFNTWLREAQKHVASDVAGDVSSGADGEVLSAGSVVQPQHLTHQAQATPSVALHKLKLTNIIDSQAALSSLVERLEKASVIGLSVGATSSEGMKARLLGISVAFGADDTAYIPVLHDVLDSKVQVAMADVLAALKPFLTSNKLLKIAHDTKHVRHVLANHGITLEGVAGDSMLASYVLASHLSNQLADIVARLFQVGVMRYEDVCGKKGKKQTPFEMVDVALAAEFVNQQALFALEAEKTLRLQMSESQRKVYENIELPVCNVLFKMERAGVLLDKQELQRQSHDLGLMLANLEQEAYQIAGMPFNLNSPKQLRELLFDVLGIPSTGLKKTTSGEISTNEEVLEKLAPDYPLPRVILNYRGLTKLKSTYTDALVEDISPVTKRIHTHFSQALTATGRLSSSNPNLQNIPVRTEEGRRVRRAFIAPAGSLLVSADYSQIELRIMAHLSQDPTLIDAFTSGDDVHRRTAAQIFSVAQSDVTSEQRRIAKTINFGLIYGMGSFGLVRALGITVAAAKQFIDRYFERYPGVARYMKEAREAALDLGYVETIFGRHLYLNDLKSPIHIKREAAIRAAVNAPMQGSASDLIKRAMITLDMSLKNNNLTSKLILQVHDELVLEVPENELQTIQQLVPQLMSNAANLRVPLLVEVGAGSHWDEAH